MTDCNHRRTPILTVLLHRHRVLSLSLMTLRTGFAVVAGRTERLEVLKVERRTALIHGTNVVHDTCRSVVALCKTAFAERLPSQLLGPQLPPRRRTVELRIGMSAAHLRSMLRLPRATACSFQCRHGQKMISELSGRSWSSVSKPTMRTMRASG